MNIEIRRLGPEDWRAYRDTRLLALKDSPDAFATVFADAVKLPETTWRERLERVDPQRDHPLMAFQEDDAIGMAVGHIPESKETAHLYQMWVSPAARGQGIARRLIEQIMAWATQRGASRIVLGVTCGDTPARRLYEQLGFAAVGEPEPLRPDSNLQVQNMQRSLDE